MTQEGFKRKLTAILSADVIGYSRLMRDDEEATVRDLAAHRVLISNTIQQNHGRVVDSPGDNILAEFASVVDAVNGAIKIQDEIKKSNAGSAEDRRMDFRIGINLGDVIEEEDRIYGDGVNIAARVEGLAAGGGIAISGTVYEHIKDKLSLGYHYLGEQEVKNISEPVRVYRLLTEPEDAGKMIGDKKPKSKKWIWAASGAIALIVLVVSAFAIWKYYFHPSFEPVSEEDMALPLPDKPSVAVLPFSNIGEPEQEYIADGITEHIITALARNPYLFVIASNSTFTYKGKSVKIQRVSRELGVRYVVEGSVQKSGDRIRITAQLIDATRGKHIWASNYDRDLKDLFALQDEITIEVLKGTMGKLTGYGGQSRAQGTTNVEAYLKVLKAITLVATNEPNNRLAQQILEECLALDSKFAEVYSRLGMSYTAAILNGWSQSPKEDFKKAFEFAKKAKALDQTLVHPHAVLGWIYLQTGKHNEALAEGRKAVAVAPSSAFANFQLGAFLAWTDQSEEAILVLKNAFRLNPFPDDWQLLAFGWAYLIAGRYEEAVAYFKKAQKRNPDNIWPYYYQAAVYGHLGRQEEASAAAKELLRLNPKFSVEQAKKWPGCKNKEKWNLLINGLRKAGLPEHPPHQLSDKPSIAVLPFVNMSGEQEQEYFSDGISEEIITALSKTPKLFVIARTSSFKYKGKKVDIRTVGRELGVRYVLEGSVRKAADKVRITAQLIDATTEKHLWAERYDRNLREIFAIQDEITLAIIKAMQVELTKGEMADMTGRGTKNLDAYLKALQAQEQWQRMDKQGTLKAKQLALEAIAIDEQYGWPYAIVSWSHMMDVWLQFSESPKESMRLAAEAIQKALTLDELDYRIHIVLSSLHIMQGKNDKAISSAQRALALCPGGAFAHAVLGTALRYACRFGESVQFREQAIKLDPFPTALGFRNLALTYSRVGRYEDAIVEYKKSLHKNPNDWAVHFGMVGAYARLNRKEEARIAARELLRIRPDFSLDWLADTTVPMYAIECRSKINDDIEFLRRADVGLQ